MLFGRQMAVAAFLAALISLGSRTMAQNEPISDWLAVPPDQGGLVFIVPDTVALFIGDEAGKILDFTKWQASSPLVRQIRLKPNTYQIRLKGPLAGVSVVIRPESVTYLRVGLFKSKFGEIGNYSAAWTGKPPDDVIDFLRAGAEKGGGTVYATPFVYTENNILTLNTEPPWPIPPPPPKK